METNKKRGTIRQKIVANVMGVSVSLGVLLILSVVISNLVSTRYLLLDNMQMMAKIASQNISANLHLLTDRIAVLAMEEVLTEEDADAEKKQRVLDERESRIEFVWLAVYDGAGMKLYGDGNAPESAAGRGQYEAMLQTGNIAVGMPVYEDGIWQIEVGSPLKKDGETCAYLIGSYKYDVLNDVLGNINVGANGSAYILNHEGMVIADREMERMEAHEQVHERYGAKRSHKVFDAMTDFETGSGSVGSYYVAYSPVAGTNWTLVVDAPGSDFMGALVVTVFVSIGLCILLVVFSVSYSGRMSKRISDSLALATNRMESLAAGNLKEPVTVAQTGDEAQTMTEALAETVTNIAYYIEALGNCLGHLSSGNYGEEVPDSFAGDFVVIRDALESITASLNDTMRKIQMASEAVNRNSSEVSDYAKRLYEGSGEQEKALGRLSGSIETIAGHIGQIDEGASDVKYFAAGAQEKVEQGKEQMDSMMSDMGEIYSSMQEIIHISRMITEISEQTGLLSLNATIEAARAGEAGRGFGIVAQQIGALAEQTAQALQQTEEMVSRAGVSIDAGMETARHTEESFREIYEVMKEFQGVSERIGRIAREQQQAVGQVAEEVRKVKEVADANRELAQRTDETAYQSLQQAKELGQVVEAVVLKPEE